jgi:hypothetical protein
MLRMSALCHCVYGVLKFLVVMQPPLPSFSLQSFPVLLMCLTCVCLVGLY